MEPRLPFRAVARGFAVTVASAPVPILLSWFIPAVHALAAPVVFATTGTIVARLTSHRGAVTGQMVLIALILVLAELLQPMWDVLYGHAGVAAVSRLGAGLMRAVGSLPGLGYFEDAEMADLLAAAREMLGSGPYILIGTMQHQTELLIGLVSMSFVAAQLGWWVPVLVVGTAVPSFVHQWRIQSLDFGVMVEALPVTRMAAYHRQLATDVSFGKESRIFGLANWLTDRQQRHWSDAWTPRWRTRRSSMQRSVLAAVVRMAVTAVPFVVAFARLASHDLAPGGFTAGVLALSSMAVQVRRLSGTATIRDGFAYLARFARLLDLARSDPRLDVTGRRTPRSGDLRLQGVSFRYPGKDVPVLDGVDLTVPAGTSLALVGVNGAGKSTIVKLLCRFYDPHGGRITLGGTDVREYDLAEYRRRIAVVFQDFSRLPLSVHDNVAIGCVERLDDRPLLERAAARASATTLIDGLADGWDTVLSRSYGGVDVSEGQWQRLALARALATIDGRDASVLILDEPTAAMDVRVEHDLYERFRDLSRGRTTLLISHRLSTVRMADRIALLEDGRITEQGTHSELLACGGRYAELWALQAGRFQ
jgi:ABC-type multidrug transport system fused ATPase/permease subunit